MNSAIPVELKGRRILLVGNDPDYFLTHRLALANALVGEGIELHVAIPFDPADGRFRNLPFTMHFIPLSRGSVNPWSEFRALAALGSLYRRLRPILVHHVTIKPILYGSIVARLLGIPCVVNSVTGVGFVFASPRASASVLRAFIRPLLKFGCRISSVTMVFENRDDLALYCREGIAQPANCRVISSSGIDVALFEPRQHREGTVTVMVLCRMLWDKGIGEFVDAARVVAARRPGTRFVLVGGTDPNPESIPLATLKGWNDSGAVEYLGWRSDIPSLLSSADILCLPSYREGLPRSLLEGGAAGLPLIATDVPGCRDALQPGVTGLLVPPRESAPLAEAILELASDVKLRERMGQAARVDVANRFSIASVIRSILVVYQEAIARSANSEG